MSSLDPEIDEEPNIMMAVREGEAAQLATLETNFVARINALDTTLHILQSKYKELENGLDVKLRSEVGGTGQLDLPENDNSGGGVVFVHYDAKQKAKKKKMHAEQRKW
jgi:hypothetical protein